MLLTFFYIKKTFNTVKRVTSTRRQAYNTRFLFGYLEELLLIYFDVAKLN